jgi:hypothetical protein
MLGGVYVSYDDGRPLVEAYDGPQIVGMDLHRRRSVLVRMTEDGQKLGTARITNSPVRLAAEIRRAGLHPKVVLEACYGWYWAADTLAAAGAMVMNRDECRNRLSPSDELEPQGALTPPQPDPREGAGQEELNGLRSRVLTISKPRALSTPAAPCTPPLKSWGPSGRPVA